MDTSRRSEELLHVLDLPQLYQKPSADELKRALDLLSLGPRSWSKPSLSVASSRNAVDAIGVPEYLTRIIASSLAWIENADERADIVDLASQRLSERSGRTGMSALTRSFQIAMDSTTDADIVIHEPALTSDNLGLKTWGSAFVLANKLHKIERAQLLTQRDERQLKSSRYPTILELGAGTGLVGLAAATVWQTHVLMTDLPEIVGNLERNLSLNTDILCEHDGQASSAVLDWTTAHMPVQMKLQNGERVSLDPDKNKFNVIIAADPIYDPSHPQLLVDAIKNWAAVDPQPLHILVAFPIRDAYLPQISHLSHLFVDFGMRLLSEALETSIDDWKDDVVVAWQVWTRPSL